MLLEQRKEQKKFKVEKKKREKEAFLAAIKEKRLKQKQEELA